MRSFDLNQRVKVRNVRGGKEKWIPGVIVAVKGPLKYLVRVPGNSTRFVHADHIIPDDICYGSPQATITLYRRQKQTPFFF